MSIKSAMITGMAVRALKYGLSNIRPFLKKHDFDKVVDLTLNGAESYFDEGSWQDVATETISTEVREYLSVPDSNPDN